MDVSRDSACANLEAGSRLAEGLHGILMKVGDCNPRGKLQVTRHVSNALRCFLDFSHCNLGVDASQFNAVKVLC